MANSLLQSLFVAMLFCVAVDAQAKEILDYSDLALDNSTGVFNKWSSLECFFTATTILGAITLSSASINALDAYQFGQSIAHKNVGTCSTFLQVQNDPSILRAPFTCELGCDAGFVPVTKSNLTNPTYTCTSPWMTECMEGGDSEFCSPIGAGVPGTGTGLCEGATDVRITVDAYDCKPIVYYPSALMTRDNECTNITPVIGELCNRVCGRPTDPPCPGPQYALECSNDASGTNEYGYCRCFNLHFDGEVDQCGPGLKCVSFNDKEEGLCLCDPNDTNSCGGPSRGVCDYVNPAQNGLWSVYPTRNLEYALLDTSDTIANRYINAGRGTIGGIGTSSGDDQLLDLYYSTIPYVALQQDRDAQYEMPICKCYEGYHGALCSNVIDQCADIMCGGSSCVTVQNVNNHNGDFFWNANDGEMALSINGYIQHNSIVEYEDVTFGDPGLFCACDRGKRSGTIAAGTSNMEVRVKTFEVTSPMPIPSFYVPSTFVLNGVNTISSCHDIVRSAYYCWGNGVTVGNEGTELMDPNSAAQGQLCNCNVDYYGPHCLSSCSDYYCSGHALNDACTLATSSAMQFELGATGLYQINSMCMNCTAGWGPSQLSGLPEDSTVGATSIDIQSLSSLDADYNQTWCSAAYGPSLASGDALTVPLPNRECAGVGFVMSIDYIRSMFEIAQPFLAYDGASLYLDSHPSRMYLWLSTAVISGPITMSGAAFTQKLATYRAAYNSNPKKTCVYCDVNYIRSGATGLCVPSVCNAWTACSITDRACTSSSYTTGLLCGGYMHANSALPRGECVITPQTASCQCADGYSGLDCGEVRCSWSNGLSCSGNGNCNEPTNRCICDDGWAGMACEIPDSLCSGNGQVNFVNPPPIRNTYGEMTIDNAEASLLTYTLWY